MPRTGDAVILELTSAPAGMPRAAIDNVLQSLRGCGLHLMIVDRGGQVIYRDSEAGIFFQRYVLPQIQSTPLQERLAEMDATAGVKLWKVIPGVTLAATPYVERSLVR